MKNSRSKESESPSVLFLYRTIPGRMLLKLLVNPFISKLAAAFLSSGYSSFLTGPFIKKEHIDMKPYIVPKGGYHSFNDFFTRKLKTPPAPVKDAMIVSPCDGLLTVLPLSGNSCFNIKNCRYSLSSLLRNRAFTEEFRNGTLFIFRLTPSHYHRYIFCSDGILKLKKRIPGVLHCVRPAALEKYPVFTENSREYTVIHNKDLGNIIQMEIGAMLVGRISNHPVSGNVTAGSEKGFFEYGGSTIIVITSRRVSINRELPDRAGSDGEIPVRIGERLL